jgi:protein-disulfide isomerase-like protein with CxxC motif
LSAAIRATLFTDPGCPWAYSASPALRVLEWRYREQLDWQLVMIGLTEQPDQYAARGYTPFTAARGHVRFRRYGMPFSPQIRPRIMSTGRACRAVTAARLLQPGSERAVFRALQFGWFTTGLLLDEDADLGRAILSVPGIDADAVVSLIDHPDVEAAYQRDRAAGRTAAGSPTELQGKAAATDGPVRYTAPSLILERDGRRLEAGGFQPVEAYDVLVANLNPGARREPPPDGPGPLLEHFTGGLTTQEAAQLLTRGNDTPDRPAAERALLELAAVGATSRTPLGDDALWTASQTPPPRPPTPMTTRRDRSQPLGAA